MPLSAGTRFGVFEIVAKLGEGGMGEVYVARDTRLDRNVALKVLPELFTSDGERLARFEREAKVLASLNHPNIAQVYGFEGTAIAMELVDGSTLDALILETAPAGLPLDRALAIARQIAVALEAAHDQGIIHRDLKPANVKVREDGTVKVLDFGLAKAFAADAESAASGVSNSPTLTARSTQLGMILGTAAYMAPEQAKGRPVDRRADVWAFGVVLFEMLAGRRAFEGDDVSDVLASVLKSEPDWVALPADLPAPVRRLLRRCLEKDPKRRLRDIGEGMLQLDEGLAGGSTSSMMPPAASGASGIAAPAALWRRAAPITTAVVLTAIVLVGANAWTTVPAEAPTPIRFQHQITKGRLWISQNYRDVGVSPDGQTIVFSVIDGVEAPGLWTRRLGQLEAAPLRGGESAGNPFVSPDNAWVGFIASADATDVKKVSILGGPPADIFRTSSAVFGATWIDGSIIFSMRGHPLHIVGDGGGTPVPLTALDAAAGEVEHLLPSAIPGTGVILFVTGNGTTPALGGELAAFDRRSGRTVRFKVAGIHPRYVPTGHIVYASSSGVLWAVAFDPATLEMSGTPVPVLEGVGIKGSGAANFDTALDGRIVYAGGLEGLSAARTITWTDRAGRETPIAVQPRNYYYVRLSPDGAYLSLDARDEQEDIWIWDLRRGAISRLTDKPGAEQYGLWMPKGLGVVFNSASGSRTELYRMRRDGTGQMEQITETSAERLAPFPNAITPDGEQVIFRAATTNSKNDLWIASMTGPRSVRKLLDGPHHELNASLSPDGKWMAYESDQSGRTEVYVRPFPDVQSGQFPVSVAGGSEPVWARNEIFFIADDSKLMAVPVSTTSGFVAEKPVVLFDVSPYYFGGQGRNYDVAADGKRFVMVKDPPAARSQTFPINVILNWTQELRNVMK